MSPTVCVTWTMCPGQSESFLGFRLRRWPETEPAQHSLRRCCATALPRDIVLGNPSELTQSDITMPSGEMAQRSPYLSIRMAPPLTVAVAKHSQNGRLVYQLTLRAGCTPSAPDAWPVKMGHYPVNSFITTHVSCHRVIVTFSGPTGRFSDLFECLASGDSAVYQPGSSCLSSPNCFVTHRLFLLTFFLFCPSVLESLPAGGLSYCFFDSYCIWDKSTFSIFLIV